MFFGLQNYVLKLIVKVCQDTFVHQQHKLFYNHLTLALEKLLLNVVNKQLDIDHSIWA